jgi:magnesium chelatase subunit D
MGIAGEVWEAAVRVLLLLAIDPGLGGVALRAPPGEARTRWLALLAQAGLPVRKMPAGIADPALLGGLDLPATLAAGRPVRSIGLLEAASGGVIVAAMAERMAAGTAARIAASLDSGGLSLVALDEGAAPDEQAPAALLDRLAFHLDFAELSHRDTDELPLEGAQIAAARARLSGITAGDDILDALCGTAVALGIDSVRAPLLALRAARAEAALDGRTEISLEDAGLAARLVLAPRATVLPSPPPPSPDETPPEPPAPDDSPPEPPPGDESRAGADAPAPQSQKLPDQALEILLAAAQAAIPAGLLARLRQQDFRGKAKSQGSQGAVQKATQRGRPAGVRAAAPGPGQRLNVIETLRAAAPWQRVRAATSMVVPAGQVLLRREDFRVTRLQARARTTTIFLVDASGSAALARLAEAKGAVELLLADCYQRRDQVAVVAFRGRGAQVLLPPTRSLVRAKRSLAGLPGGGGTPLAAAIDAGFMLAAASRRGGFTPTLVLLTDGRANVTRAGTGGRAAAQAEAACAARRVRAAGVAALVLDTSPRPGPEARELAAYLGALYIPLPFVNATSIRAATLKL